jgi:hypothetical protein
MSDTFKYGGWIRKRKDRRTCPFEVQFQLNGRKENRSFATEKEAVAYQMLRSDELGLTRLPREIVHIPKNIRKWCVWFVEGDGNISIPNTRFRNINSPNAQFRARKHGSVHITVGQSRNSGEPPELVQIQKYYGGKIDKRVEAHADPIEHSGISRLVTNPIVGYFWKT